MLDFAKICLNKTARTAQNELEDFNPEQVYFKRVLDMHVKQKLSARASLALLSRINL
jgi:hypothetical protein